jgi:hypothetical protein
MLSHSPLCFHEASLENQISDLLCDEEFLLQIRNPPMLDLSKSCKKGDMKKMVARLVHALVKLFGEC